MRGNGLLPALRHDGRGGRREAAGGGSMGRLDTATSRAGSSISISPRCGYIDKRASPIVPLGGPRGGTADGKRHAAETIGRNARRSETVANCLDDSGGDDETSQIWRDDGCPGYSTRGAGRVAKENAGNHFRYILAWH